MITLQATATLAAAATGNATFRRQTNTAVTANVADTTTISTEARDRLSSEQSKEIPDNTYRLEGSANLLEDLVKSKGRPFIAVKMTEDQINEIKRREQQEQARLSANTSYAETHQYQPVGQVLVNGKVFATVYDSGAYDLPYPMANLSEQTLSPADRLAEIARATNGEVIHSDLLPTNGGGAGSGAPESMLPPITARSMSEILAQEIAPAMEKQIKAWEMQTGKTFHSTIEAVA